LEKRDRGFLFFFLKQNKEDNPEGDDFECILRVVLPETCLSYEKEITHDTPY
jgi:hypothetical protein